MYLDDGHSLAFRRGAHLRQSFRCDAATPGRLRLEIGAREGSYEPWWRELAVVVHGWSGAAAVRAGGRTVDARTDTEAGTLRFTVAASRAAATIDIGPR